MLTKRIIPWLDVKYGDGNRALVVMLPLLGFW